MTFAKVNPPFYMIWLKQGSFCRSHAAWADQGTDTRIGCPNHPPAGLDSPEYRHDLMLIRCPRTAKPGIICENGQEVGPFQHGFSA